MKIRCCVDLYGLIKKKDGFSSRENSRFGMRLRETNIFLGSSFTRCMHREMRLKNLKRMSQKRDCFVAKM